jgi:hypothetical protein
MNAFFALAQHLIAAGFILQLAGDLEQQLAVPDPIWGCPT